MQSRFIFAMHVKKLKSKYLTMSIWGGIRGANMGYAVYAVHRSATPMGGGALFQKQVFENCL